MQLNRVEGQVRFHSSVYCNNGGLYSEIQGHQLQNLSAIETIVREIGIGEIVDGLLSSRVLKKPHLH
jgi:hypothetical protein